jgi:hypothetical protein
MLRNLTGMSVPLTAAGCHNAVMRCLYTADMPELVSTQVASSHSPSFGEAIARQREMLTDLLTVPMFKMARRLGALIELRNALEFLLIDEIEQLPYCSLLYVLDAGGHQVTASVSRHGVDRSQYGRDRSGSHYLQDIIGVSDFRLSRACAGRNGRRPSITAIQVIRDRSMQRVGFLGADFDLRELPHTGASYRDIGQWRPLKGDPAVHTGLFRQQRVESVTDLHIDTVLAQLGELITARGVFHGKLHFSSNRAAIWLTDDPYHYRLLGLEELTSPDLCLAWAPRAYPELAVVPEHAVMPVLERFRQLRCRDENVYLRSGSLNIFNGTVGLNFSCDGSHYMNFREFLDKDMRFWTGLRCAT